MTGGASGRGTVFKMDAAGNLTSLHSFENNNNGYPYAALIQAADGTFYGTTAGLGCFCQGGNCFGGYGTVFKMDAVGNVTALHTFNSLQGANPHGALVQDADGNLYGTTTSHIRRVCSTTPSCRFRCSQFGCYHNVSVHGTVFKIDTSGAFSVLHTFTAVEEPVFSSVSSSTKLVPPPSPGTGSPGGLILASDGNLYGTTTGGASHIFRVSPAGSYETLHSLTAPEGSSPSAGLLQAVDGNFYGPTLSGGVGGVGTIFKMDSSNSETTLYSFPTEGSSPQASLIQATGRHLLRHDLGRRRGRLRHRLQDGFHGRHHDPP